jgi:hypothetical protein
MIVLLAPCTVTTNGASWEHTKLTKVVFAPIRTFWLLTHIHLPKYFAPAHIANGLPAILGNFALG